MLEFTLGTICNEMRLKITTRRRIYSMANNKRDPLNEGRAKERRPGWVGLGVILLVDAVAMYLCTVATPWQASTVVAGFILIKGFIPLLFLAWLAYRVRSIALREWGRLDEDNRLLEILPSKTERLITLLENSRKLALGQATNATPGGAAPSIVNTLNMPEDSLITLALERVQQQYMAGETVSSESLIETVEERALDRVDPLQRYHEAALALGFAGTVLGLAVQGYFAQSFGGVGILSNAFLTGFMMATTSTFVGIIVAAYARILRSRLIQGLDRLCYRIACHLSFSVFPSCDPRTRSTIDLSNTFQVTVENFTLAVEAMAARLDKAIEDGVDKAIKRIEAYSTENFIEALQKNVVNPFAREVKEIGSSLTSGTQGIQSTTLMLARKTEDLKSALNGAIKVPGEVSKNMVDASAEMKGLIMDIEMVRHKFESVTGLMSSANEKLILSIADARGMDKDMRSYFNRETSGARELARELRDCAITLLEAVDATTKVIEAGAGK